MCLTNNYFYAQYFELEEFHKRRKLDVIPDSLQFFSFEFWVEYYYSKWVEEGLNFQLLIFVNGRAIYGLPFILNMAENLSPEEDLESLRVQWTLLMSGWVFY